MSSGGCCGCWCYCRCGCCCSWSGSCCWCGSRCDRGSWGGCSGSGSNRSCSGRGSRFGELSEMKHTTRTCSMSAPHRQWFDKLSATIACACQHAVPHMQHHDIRMSCSHSHLCLPILLLLDWMEQWMLLVWQQLQQELDTSYTDSTSAHGTWHVTCHMPHATASACCE